MTHMQTFEKQLKLKLHYYIKIKYFLVDRKNLHKDETHGNILFHSKVFC